MKRILYTSLITLCCLVLLLAGTSSLYADWCSPNCQHCQQKEVVKDCLQKSSGGHSGAHVVPEGDCEQGVLCSVSSNGEAVLLAATAIPALPQVEQVDRPFLNLGYPVTAPAVFSPAVAPKASPLHVLNCVFLI